jgi:hypothetical protein
MNYSPKLEIKPRSESQTYTLNLDENDSFMRFTVDDLKEIFNLDEEDYNRLAKDKQCTAIVPYYINSPANDPDNPELLTNRLTTIDYGGLSSRQTDNDYDYLFGGKYTQPPTEDSIEREKYGANVVKNLNIVDRGNVYGGTPALREYYGNISINGTKITSTLSRVVSLFTNSPYLKKVAGDLEIKNANDFRLCTGKAGSTMGVWYNVIDIRNVDTATCTAISVLNYISTPCTLIVGNFSNENITSLSASLLMSGAPDRGRILVLTTETPPRIKNCRYDADKGGYRHSDTYDWVKRGKFNIIYVPRGYKDAYDNDVFIEGSEVGKNGWSFYGKYGEDIIVEYDPTKKFLPKKEGGENGRTVWIYRESNKGK